MPSINASASITSQAFPPGTSVAPAVRWQVGPQAVSDQFTIDTQVYIDVPTSITVTTV